MTVFESVRREAPQLCERFRISRLGVFGSVARCEDSSGSDIDFYAEFNDPTPASMPDRYLGFIEAASKLFDRPIQVVTPRMLKNPHFNRSMKQDLVIIHD